MRVILLLLALLPLAACDTTGVTDTATVQTASVPADVAAAGASVSVEGTAPAGAALVGPVEATGCQKTHYDPEPDNAFVLALLKAEAAKRGATTLVGVSYQRYNVSFTQNCMTTIIAKGVAWK